MQEIVTRISTTEAKLDASLRTAQRKFGSDNNLRIEENAMQDKLDKMKQ